MCPKWFQIVYLYSLNPNFRWKMDFELIVAKQKKILRGQPSGFGAAELGWARLGRARLGQELGPGSAASQGARPRR